MQVLNDAVFALRTSNDTEKVENYGALRDVLYNLYVDKYKIRDETFHDILDCVDTDLSSTDATLQKLAALVLDLVFKIKGEKYYRLEDVPASYLHMAFDKPDQSNDITQPVHNTVKSLITDLCMRDLFDVEELLLRVEDKPALSKLLVEIVKGLFLQKAVKTLYFNIIPVMFTTLNAEVRGALIEIAYELKKTMTISVLNNAERKKFINSTKHYLKKIGSIQSAQHSHWSKLWCFIVEIYAEVLHHELDITNSLLRIVETAFRSSVYSDKEIAYDCWETLIDNCSLDLNYLCNDKQMKLIVTPLKSNVSRSETLIGKKFKLWIKLMDIVKTRSLLCVSSFLIFCFGPFHHVGKSLRCSSRNPSLVAVWRDATFILIELLGNLTITIVIDSVWPIKGHHGHSNDCRESSSRLSLDGPIITSQNIVQVPSVLNAVVECSCTMSLCFQGKTVAPMDDCLWGSLMNAMYNVKSAGDKEKLFISLGKLLTELFALLNSDNHFVITRVFSSLICVLKDVDQFKNDSYCDRYFVYPCIKQYLHQERSNEETDAQFKIIWEIMNIKGEAAKRKIFLKSCLKILQTEDDAKSANVLRVWLKLSSIALSILKEKEKDNMDTYVALFIFPIPHKAVVVLSEDDRNEYFGSLRELFVALCEADPVNLTKIVNSLKDSPKNTDEHVTRGSLLMDDLHKELKQLDQVDRYRCDLLKMLCKLLSSMKLPKDAIDQIELIIVHHLDQLYNDHNFLGAETFTVLCECIQLLLHYKSPKVLKSISENFQHLPASFQDQLRRTIEVELHKVDADLQPSLPSLLRQLQSGSTCSKTLASTAQTPQMSRGARIATMSQGSTAPKSDVLRMFGRDAHTLTPVKLRGSQLQNAAKRSPTPKKVAGKLLRTNPPDVLGNDAANYVLFDSEVKVDVAKLSEHQIEAYKKKRDIPALYEDLSQSQSNSTQDLIRKCAVANTTPKNNAENKTDAATTDSTRSSTNHDTLTTLTPLGTEEKTEQHTLPFDINNKKVRSVLRGIKMDIVGGEKVLENIAGPRRTRTGKKIETDVTAHDTSVTPTTNGKKRGRRSDMSDSCYWSSVSGARKRRKPTCACCPPQEVNAHAEPNSLDVIESSQEDSVSELNADDQPSMIQEKDGGERALSPEIMNSSGGNLSELRVNLFGAQQSKDVEPIAQTPTLSEPMSDDDVPAAIDANLTCELETQTAPREDESQQLPASPITADTPTKSSELITNTCDISPIKNNSHAKIVHEVADSDATETVLSKGVSDYQRRDVHKEEDKVHGRRRQDVFGKLIARPHKKTKQLKLTDLREDTKNGSPKTERVLKMMQNCEETRGVTTPTPLKKIEHRFLTFASAVPSPYASPKCGILKRKMLDPPPDDDVVPSKRKRANFSDPPLTCKATYIKGDDEHPRPPIALNFNGVSVEEEEEDDEDSDKEVVNDDDDAVQIEEMTLEEEMNKSDAIIDEDVSPDISSPTSDSEEQMLVSKVPVRAQPLYKSVCPALINCTDEIDEVVLCSLAPHELHWSALGELLSNREIFTIGDLARLNDIEINSLPLREPKVDVLQQTLDGHQIHLKEEIRPEVPSTTVANVQSVDAEVKTLALNFNNVLHQLQKENVDLKEFISTISTTTNNCAHTYNSFTPASLANAKRFLKLINSITDSLELNKLLVTILTVSNTNAEDLMKVIFCDVKGVRFDPTLNLLLNSFENVNVVKLGEVAIEKLSGSQTDLNRFITKVFEIVGLEKVVNVIPKETMLKSLTSNRFVDSMSTREIKQHCSVLMGALAKRGPNVDTLNELLTPLLDAMPIKDVIQYYSAYLDQNVVRREVKK